jgi:hypothetical protein
MPAPKVEKSRLIISNGFFRLRKVRESEIPNLFNDLKSHILCD